MVLRDDAAATEVMTYVAWMFMLIGCWLAVQVQPATPDLALKSAWPVVFQRLTLLGCLVFTGSNGEGLSWAAVPDVVFVALLFVPLAAVLRGEGGRRRTKHRLDLPSTHPLPLDAVVVAVMFAFTGDVWMATATAVLFVPLYRSTTP